MGKTNYEAIKSMSKEQLAEFLAIFWNRDMVPKKYTCNMVHPCLGCPEHYCCFIGWLEEPCTDVIFKWEEEK